MAKLGPRRTIKRKPARPKIDDDLAELADVLAQNTGPKGSAGWFSIPWRFGWNAVRLAFALCGNTLPTWNRDSEDRKWLEALLESPNPTKSAALYWRAQDLLLDLNVPREKTAARAALRCLQVYVGESDGGGALYNDILRPVFEAHEANGVSFGQDLMLRWRCQDAIYTTIILQNDKNDRYRRAFKIAWERGLYQAAYAIREVY